MFDLKLKLEPAAFIGEAKKLAISQRMQKTLYLVTCGGNALLA